MKRLFIISTIFLCCLAACAKDSQLPESTSAAKKMYEKYSDRQDLTVAMIGNYSKGGDTYDALMLQALTDEAWDSLMVEFGIDPRDGFDQITSLTSARLTSAGDIDNLKDLADAIVDSIMGQIHGEVQCHKTYINKTYEDGVLVEDESTEEDENFTLDTVIDGSLKNGLLSGILNSLGMHIDTDLVDAAIEEGMTGYVIHLESRDRTIWLFFYDSQEGYDAIMQHVDNTAGKGLFPLHRHKAAQAPSASSH